MIRTRSPFQGYLMFIVIGGLLGWYWHVGQGHVSYTMDSLTYRDAALNVLRGNGLVTTNTFEPTPEFLPLLQWPPAYPLMWAGMAALGLGIDAVPQVLSPLLYVATLALVYLIAQKMADGRYSGAFASFLFVASPTGLAPFNFAWSETLFIPLILLSFYALLRYPEAEEKKRVGWLLISAVCIGLANWTRYSGAVFLPLLGVSVLLIGNGKPAARLRDAALAVMMALLVVAPLWIRNYSLTGMLSGSERGGQVKTGGLERISSDLESLWNLVVYPLFSFDTLLYALFGLPLLGLVAYVAWTNRMRLLSPSRPIALAIVWAAVNLLFLLVARVFQQGIDFDYRMLAIPAPFVVSAVVALLADRPRTASSVLLVSILLLSAKTTLDEGSRIRERIAGNLPGGWRTQPFGMVYQDLHKDFAYSKEIQLPPMANHAVVLSDYRGLLMRYLSGHPAYQVLSPDNCLRLRKALPGPIAYVVAQPTRNWHFDTSATPTAKCMLEKI